LVASKTKNGGIAIDEPPQGSMNGLVAIHGVIHSVNEHQYFTVFGASV
jgi:hypothetical protein